MKKLLRILVLVLVATLMLVTVVACDKQPETQDPDTSTDEESYGVVLKVLSSPFWQSMEQGIKDKAAELGVKVEVLAANTEDDVEGQVVVLENVVTKGFSAIAVAPLTADNCIKAIVDANEKGLLVANVDEQLNMDSLEASGGSIVSFVATDNVVVGRTAGEYIASLVEGDVAIIEGKAGTPSGEDRKTGAMEAFTTAGLNLVDSQPADWDRTKAYDLATNMIAKNENLKAIYCCNDTMAMGAQEAVEKSGKDIVVVGTDGNPDAIQSVADGKLSATVAQDPAGVGARSLELLVQAFRAGEKPGEKEAIIEMVNPILVTAENADEHLSD